MTASLTSFASTPRTAWKWGGGDSAEETKEYAYDDIADLMKNLLKDHSRHCIAGVGDYHGLTGKELGTSEEIGKRSYVLAVRKTAVRTGATISRIAS
jgi:hypothetical protein